MATLTLDGLEEALGSLHLDILPHLGCADPLERPLDIARCYLAKILAGVAEVKPELAYNSIQWPNNIFNGDLVVILPKLSHGADPEEYALQILPKVCVCVCVYTLFKVSQQNWSSQLIHF